MTPDYAAEPIRVAIDKLKTDLDVSNDAIQRYKGYEDSKHYPPWINRKRLLTRAIQELQNILDHHNDAMEILNRENDIKNSATSIVCKSSTRKRANNNLVSKS